MIRCDDKPLKMIQTHYHARLHKKKVKILFENDPSNQFQMKDCFSLSYMTRKQSFLFFVYFFRKLKFQKVSTTRKLKESNKSRNKWSHIEINSTSIKSTYLSLLYDIPRCLSHHQFPLLHLNPSFPCVIDQHL